VTPMIAEVREKLRVDESLASVDEEAGSNVDVEIDVFVAVAVEKVRILEKRESMRAVEKWREEDFMVFRAIDESLSGKGEGKGALPFHSLATIKIPRTTGMHPSGELLLRSGASRRATVPYHSRALPPYSAVRCLEGACSSHTSMMIGPGRDSQHHPYLALPCLTDIPEHTRT